MSFGELLKEARKNKKVSQESVGKSIGVSRGAIANYETGNNAPTFENMVKLMELLDFTLVGGIDAREVNQIPIIGTASCGDSEINCLQDGTKKANYNGEFWSEELYCVIASGDSMSPEIDDCDEIIIDPNVKSQNGDIVHYMIDGESAIKLLVIDEEAYIMQFVPYNQTENFKTRTVRLDDEDTLSRLQYNKVVSVNKLKFNNRIARLRLIGRA